jgi:hypothetical protein
VAGLARVQAGGTGTTTGTSLTGAITLAGVGVGHGLIICIAQNLNAGGLGTISGVSDTHNTYVQSGAATADSTNKCAADLWFCKQVTTGGSLTITVTATVANGLSATAVEVSGQDTGKFIDSFNSASGTAAATPASGNTGATKGAGEFCVGTVNLHGSGALATSPVFGVALTSSTTETLANNSTTAEKGALTTIDGLVTTPGSVESFGCAVGDVFSIICATFLASVPPQYPDVKLQAVHRASMWCKGERERLWTPRRRIYLPA